VGGGCLPCQQCRAETITIQCSHGREATGVNPILEVVPDDGKFESVGLTARSQEKGAETSQGFGIRCAVMATDKITLLADMYKPCGSSHPQWTIVSTGGDQEKRNGPATTLEVNTARHIGLWLYGVQAKTYSIMATGCKGGPLRGEIKTFPNTKIKIKFTTSTFKLLSVLETTLKEAMSTVISDPQLKIARGSLAFEGGWEEYTDYRAFFAFKIRGGFAPLLGIGGDYILLGLPGWLTSIARKARINLEGGVYIGLYGEIGFMADLLKNQPDGLSSMEFELRGAIEVSAGVKLDVPKVISTDFSGNTEIEGVGTGPDIQESGVWVFLTVTWYPLRVAGYVEVLDGLFSWTAEKELLKKMTIVDEKPFNIVPKEEA
jgi:hypothetical protein